jgi:XRE family aerobic/anaerobic benzoate catabolism transcriptional regulator
VKRSEDTAIADTATVPLAAAERVACDHGRRIRRLREERGMSRRLLALESSVSERYLAHVESGSGNISVMLLVRVADALAVDVVELFAPDGGEPENDRARRTRIALIGLRGAGKSTLGAMLAKAHRVPLVELNREVTRETGLPTSEVMSLYGTAGYRRIEQRVLERAVRERGEAVIVAGGGIVNCEEAFDFLLAHCFTIWIRARPEEHMARVLAQGDLRPMAGHAEAMDDLRRILTVREPLYRRADLAIDTSGETARQSFAKLKRELASTNAA